MEALFVMSQWQNFCQNLFFSLEAQWELEFFVGLVILVSLASYYAAYPYMLGPVYMKVGDPQIGEVTGGGSPHLSCKRDRIKMRDYMDRRVTPPKWVTSPTWGPPPPCKQALRGTQVTNIKQDKVSKENVVQPNSAATTKIENSKKQIKVYYGKTKQQ